MTIAVISLLICIEQLSIIEYLMSDHYANIFGVKSLSSVNGKLSFASMLLAFLCLAIYNELLIFCDLRPPKINITPTEIKFEDKKDSLPEEEGRRKSIIQTVTSNFVKFYKYCTMTPFLTLEITRGIIIIWVIKYSTYWSLPLLCWLYYSISFTDTIQFYKNTRVILIPIVGFQYILCKIVNLPYVCKFIERTYNIKVFERFGGFIFELDSDNKMTSPEFEYFFMGSIFIIICLTTQMTRYIKDYELWKQDHPTNYSDPSIYSTWEAIINFILHHSDKLFIVTVYIVGFNKLNLTHALLLGSMIITMEFPEFTSRNFKLFIALLLFRDAGRYIELMIQLSGVDLTDTNWEYALIILGFDNDLNQNRMFFKASVDWEIPVMIYISYMQLNVYKYLDENKERIANREAKGFFIDFIKKVYSFIKKILIFMIYWLILVLLANEDITAVFSIYNIMLMIIIVVHFWSDINDFTYPGMQNTKRIWHALNVYNGLVLLASYLFCFAVYRMGAHFEFSDKTKAICKLIGFDFVYPYGTSFVMQKKFLSQFVILYLGFLATSHINTFDQSHSSIFSKTHSSRFFNLLLKFVDLLSMYSFHIMFLLVAIIGFAWKLSIGMLLFFVLFGVHYCALHIGYTRSRKEIPSNQDYIQLTKLAEEGQNEQKWQSLILRKSTTKLLLLLTVGLIIMAVLSRFTDHLEILVETYWSGKERLNGLELLEFSRALQIYFGVFHRELRMVDTFNSNIFGYVIILLMIALEIKSADWYLNRMRYDFVYIPNDSAQLNLDTVEIKRKKSILYAKYKYTIMMISKCMLEHVVIATICISAIVKNNVLQMLFLPIALFCLFFGTTLKSTLAFSCYSWGTFALHYFFEVITMKHNSVPQYIDDLVIIRAFHLKPSQWPLYKLIFGTSQTGLNWAAYFLGEHSCEETAGFMTDILSIFVQIIYFQHFCHKVYSLSSKKPTKKDQNRRKSIVMDEQNLKSGVLFRTYSFIKGIFFVYSHIFSLFILLLLGVYSGGLINLLYVIFCVAFMQYDLFSQMGVKSWSLPRYVKFPLKPYIFIDLTVQFIIQIPWFLTYSDSNLLQFIGMQRIEENSWLVILKSIMLSVILYQDRICATEQYDRCCLHEREKIQKLSVIRKNCMAYLYNNKRIADFAYNAYSERQHQDSMSQITKTIDQWNQIILRKDSGLINQYTESILTEPGVQLEVIEIGRKITELKRKLDRLDLLKESDWKNKGFFVAIYLWLYHKVNFILLKSLVDLSELQDILIKGSDYIPGKLIDLFQEQHKINIKLKILQEQSKLLNIKITHISTNDFEEKQKHENALAELQPQIENTRKKQKELTDELEKLTSFKNIVPQIFGIFFRYVYSSIDFVCYFFMVIAQYQYGNLLSSVYVALLFSYVLVVRCRPHKQFWKFILGYAGFVIIAKITCGMIYEYFINYKADPSYAHYFENLQMNVF